jgi:hypothetical protein
MTRKQQKRLILSVIGAILTIGGMFIFAAAASSHELILGIMASVLTVLLTSFAWRRMQTQFSPTLSQLLTVWRLPWYIVSETWELILILYRIWPVTGPAPFTGRVDSTPLKESLVIRSAF